MPQAFTRFLTDEEKSDAADFGQAWAIEHAALLDSLPRGTVIAVNITDGQYVTADSALLAMDRFEDCFGLEAIAWVHEVGVPISVGVGLWALSSETST